MKKLALTAVLMLGIAGGTAVFAQAGGDGALTYVNVVLDKIWVHNLGYVVQYRTRSGSARAYLPTAWFLRDDERGLLRNVPRRDADPSMTVFYRDGQFAFVMLNLPHRTHRSWGFVPKYVNIDGEFDVQAVRLEF
ncbi:MAG: hypothetical protein FWD94_07895 [Treponema sp.]|nr:hypothetical protein [Treponema sp.]